MKILHITPHLGGGVGTVIMDWMGRIGGHKSGHQIICLDFANEKAKKAASDIGFSLGYDAGKKEARETLNDIIKKVDIVLIHYWDHPMLADLFSKPIPDCRLVFWCHKNILYTEKELAFPDLWIDTSPIQGHGRHIWSTGNMDRFLAIKPKPHWGFNIGYVGTVDYKKIHANFLPMCEQIAKDIPSSHFTIVGENKIGGMSDSRFTFTGKVDDVAPYLAEMDIFGYPLRPDHYGTCEQALGEAMAAGVVPVTMRNPAERRITLEPPWPKGMGYVDIVEGLYQLPEGRKVLSAFVRELARKCYSIDTMIQQWNEVFNEIIEQPKRSRGVL